MHPADYKDFLILPTVRWVRNWVLLIGMLFSIDSIHAQATFTCNDITSKYQDFNPATKRCGPRNLQWTVGFRFPFEDVGNLNNYRIRFYWDYDNNPGLFTEVVPVWNDVELGYEASQSYTYPDNGMICTYFPKAVIRIDGSDCSNANGYHDGSIQVWDDLGNPSLGTIQAGPFQPSVPPDEWEICEGDQTPVIFDDESDFNCTSAEPEPANRNDRARWVQWIYGTDMGANLAGDITINGITYTDPELPLYGDIEYLPAAVTLPNSTALDIVMPVNSMVGETFEVTLRSWNVCNPYDDNVFDGSGLNPAGGTIAVGPDPLGTWVGASFPDAVSAAITTTKTIVVIDSPDPPNDQNITYCVGDAINDIILTNYVPGARVSWYDGPDPGTANLLAGPVVSNIMAPNTLDAAIPAGTATPASSGEYHFWATQELASGCVSNPAEIVLTIRNELSISQSINGPPNSCPSVSGLEYFLSGDPSPPTMTYGGLTRYEWSVPGGWTINSGQGTSRISVTSNSVASSGQVSVMLVYDDNSPSCSSTPVVYDVNVYQPPQAASITGNTTICYNSATDLTFNLSGGASPYDVEINGGLLNLNDIPDGYVHNTGFLTADATYTISAVTDDNGCTIYPGDIGPGATVTVRPEILDQVPTVDADHLCYNTSTTVRVPAPQPNVEYALYDGSTNLSGGWISSGILNTPLLTTDMVLSVRARWTTVPRCRITFSNTITLAVNPQIDISASLNGFPAGPGPEDEICESETIDLNSSAAGGSGTFSYAWSGPSGYSNSNADPIPFTPPFAGGMTLTYSLQVTDDNFPVSGGGHCLTGISMQVIVNTEPSASISGNTPDLCVNTDRTLHGNPLAGTGAITTHLWTGPDTSPLSATNVEGPTLNTLNANTYTFTYTVSDNKGCSASDTKSINVTGPSADILVNGLSASNASVCNGGILSLDGNPVAPDGIMSHSWTGNTGPLSATDIQTPVFTTALTGTYILNYEITDNNGCKAGDIVSIDVQAVNADILYALSDSGPYPGADLTPAICAGEDLYLDGNPSGGTPTYINQTWTLRSGPATYSLSPGSNDNKSVFNASGGGTYEFSFSLEDQSGCTFTTDPAKNIIITVNPPISVSIPAMGDVCEGSDIDLPAAVLTGPGSGGPYAWLWTGDDITNSSTANNDLLQDPDPFTTTSPGIPKTYQVTVTDHGFMSLSGNCVANTSLNVNVNPMPDFKIISTAADWDGSEYRVCRGYTTDIVVENSENGIDYYLYDISDLSSPVNSPVTGNGSDLNIVTNPVSAETTFRVIGVNPVTGCERTMNDVTIELFPWPAPVTIAGDQDVCVNITEGYSVSPIESGATYSWSVPVEFSGAGGAVSYPSGPPYIGPVLLLDFGSVAFGPVDITVTASKNGCISAPLAKSIEAHESPSVTMMSSAGPDGTVICQGTQVTFTANSSTATEYAFRKNGIVIQNSSLDTWVTSGLNNGDIMDVIASVPGGCSGTSNSISHPVVPVPVISAVPVSQAICSGTSTSVTLISSVGGAVFDWQVITSGPGISGASDGTGPLIDQVLTNSGTLSSDVVYRATATASVCVSDPLDINVTVNPLPEIYIGDSLDVCLGNSSNMQVNLGRGTEPLVVRYRNVNTGTETNVYNLYDGDNISITPGNPGWHNFDITYIEDANGCSDSGDPVSSAGNFVLQVASKLIASITASKNVICSGDQVDVTFHLLGGIGPFDVMMDVNGIPDTLLNIDDGFVKSYTLATSTNFTMVSVTDDGFSGCDPLISGASLFISVSEYPSAVMSGDNTICENESAALTITLTGTGPWNVRYRVNGGATSTLIPNIQNNGSPTIYQLDVSPGTGTSIYEITEVRNLGTPAECVGTPGNGNVTGSATVEVNDLPSAMISGSASICGSEETEIMFNLTGTGPFDLIYTDGLLNYGLTNIPAIYSVTVNPESSTQYTLVSVSDNNDPVCNGVVSGMANIQVQPVPAAGFGMDKTRDCSPAEVTFDNYSTGNLQGDASGYYYRDQDSTDFVKFSEDLFTSYTFENNSNNIKIFEVYFIAQSSAGCADTMMRTLTVDPSVGLNVTTDDPLEGCPPYTMIFNNNNVVSGVMYVWAWGDGEPNDTTYMEAGLSHEFMNSSTTSAKTYYVKVNALNPATGCGQTKNISVHINPDMVVDVESDITEGCAPLYINLSNNSLGVSSYRWFYRLKGTNEIHGEVTTPFANYQLSNTTMDSLRYEVIFTGENGAGCQESDTIDVVVWPEFSTEFTALPESQYLPGRTITLTNLTNEGPWLYHWDFGDGNSASGPDITDYTYETYGNYEIRLDVSYGPCLGTHTESIVIEPLEPAVDFDAEIKEGCRPLTVHFINKTQFADKDSYYWEFGDNLGTSTVENPVFTFYNPGEYRVSLLASNDLGIEVRQEYEMFIRVFDVPVAQFRVRPTVVYVPDEPVYTSNLSYDASVFFWDFGDGVGIPDTSTLEEPTYIYTQPGIYDIFLRVENYEGCVDSLLIKEAVRAELGGKVSTPNVFTPDPDGPGGGSPGNAAYNDVFLPVEEGVVEFHMQVFNRWGEMLYETYDKNTGWDGYYKGKLAAADVYVYKLDLKLNNGQRVTRLGDVMLLR